ncbi:MAG: hypothetical protein P8N76_03770 [Pirellulaceae bacterium]|nr:hypothetical protein [Pirellulaceae bacterium]
MLSNDYRFDTLGKTQLNGALTPVALQAAVGPYHLSLVGSGPLPAHRWEVGETANRLAIEFWLDHQFAHPRFSFEGPDYRNWHNPYDLQVGQQLEFSFYLCVSRTPVPIVVPGRYPQRNRAVFSITDHADHDSCERVNALWHGHSRPSSRNPTAGFIGRKLPFTKSVFPATPKSDGPGLHNPDFVRVCRDGHAGGIEICPHGVHSSVQPRVNELEALLSPFDEFKPRTWIDHGNRFLSNYGRRGWDPSDEYSLHPWLDRLGIRYIWGRLDFGHALPQGQLDQLETQQFCGSAYIRDLPSNTRRALAAKRPWAVLHGMSVLAYQLIPEKTMLQFFLAQRKIQRVMSADLAAVPGAFWQSTKMAAALALPPGVSDLLRHVGGVREEISMIPIFYPEHHSLSLGSGTLGSQAAGDNPRWLFNTLAIHDVEKAYAPEAIDRLIRSYGIHFSHTYLTSISRAHLSHAITAESDGHWRLTDKFADNLQQLANRRDEGQIWVASMAEIGDFWAATRKLRISPTDDNGWQFSYPTASSLPIDLQLVVLGEQVANCFANQQPVEIESISEQVHIGQVPVRPGETVAVQSSIA